MKDIEHRESFKILLLSRANRVLGNLKFIYRWVVGCSCWCEVVFSNFIKMSLSFDYSNHNHPIGSTVTSDADQKLTKKIVEIGKLLDMPVLDHIIFTSASYL